MNLPNVPVGATVELRAWASPNEGMTLDQLVIHMEEIGNKVLQVDAENNRLLLLYTSQANNG